MIAMHPPRVRGRHLTRTIIKTYPECTVAHLAASVDKFRREPGVHGVAPSTGFGFIFIDHDRTVDKLALADLARGSGFLSGTRGSATIGATDAESRGASHLKWIVPVAVTLALGALAGARQSNKLI